MKKSILSLAAVLFASSTLFAQFRDGGKDGINVFENPKVETEFTGIKTSVGAGFTMGFQALDHSNFAIQNISGGVDQNKLTKLRSGFNLPSANLSLNTQLADGVALKMELYLAARHHNETWVKGGYVQFDKIPFLKSDLVDNIMKYTTLKMGQMEVNYGDAHFRRSDGGHTIYNPFIENNIIDAFATEVGLEANVNYNGFIGSFSITNGLLKGNVDELDSVFVSKNPPANTIFDKNRLISSAKNNPSFIGKIGFDKEFIEGLRTRLTGSIYYNAGAYSNTLYSGDRTGSNYFGVMEYRTVGSLGTGSFTTGRYSPGFNDKVLGIMGNLFVKWNGLESFTTVESMSGRGRAQIDSIGDRTAFQFSTDLIYRFGADENFYVGVRYNTVNAEQFLAADLKDVTGATVAGSLPTDAKVDFVGRSKGLYDVNINRIAVSAGWFITKNVMAKVEYTSQTYGNFLYNDIRSGAKFNGIVAQAVIGF